MIKYCAFRLIGEECYIYIYDEKYSLLISLLGHNLNKEIRLLSQFDCARAPYKIGRVMLSLVEGFSQPPPPLQWMLQ